MYTTHGLMTPADLDEYRHAYDWYELPSPDGAEDTQPAEEDE